jgi:putative tricarboxylic transport membrane protein
MTNRPNNRLTASQIADFAVLICLALLVIGYLIHVLSVSTHILNIILVVPVSVTVLVLCLIEFIVQCRCTPTVSPQQEPVGSVIAVMGLFIGYVLSLPWLGFDLGTVIFIGAFLSIYGEKRWHWILAYAVVFGFLVALLFSSLLPYPMPMSILPTEY